jgi:Holliday junction resolvasome RuvABC DNA-binding subunit
MTEFRCPPTIVIEGTEDPEIICFATNSDSVLFDFCYEDGMEVFRDIIKIMKVGNKFPVKVYTGESYDSVAQIYP